MRSEFYIASVTVKQGENRKGKWEMVTGQIMEVGKNANKLTTPIQFMPSKEQSEQFKELEEQRRVLDIVSLDYDDFSKCIVARGVIIGTREEVVKAGAEGLPKVPAMPELAKK